MGSWRMDLYWRLWHAAEHERVIVRVQYRDEVDLIGDFVGVAPPGAPTHMILRTLQDRADGTETHIRLNKHTLIEGVPAREWAT